MVWPGFCEGQCQDGGRNLWGVHISCCRCIIPEYHAHWFDSLPVPFSLAWTNLRQHSDYGGILALRAHCGLLLDQVPPEEPTSTPLETPLELGHPNWTGGGLEGDLPGSCVSQAQHKLRHVLNHWPLVGYGFSIV